MTDLIKRNDAIDILCKFCQITEDVEECRKTSADGWCKRYCELKNMPTIKAIPVEDIQKLYIAAVAYRDRFNPYSDNWIAANDQAIGVRSILDMWEDY